MTKWWIAAGAVIVLATVAAVVLLDDGDPSAGPSTTLATTTTTATATTGSGTSSTTSRPATIDYEPVFEEGECLFLQEDIARAVPFERETRCGWLEVPENRSVDNGRTVRLHVAVFASDAADPAPDPVVHLVGGPGGSALETVPLGLEQQFGPFLADREFVLFDQRGTGYSEPGLACPELTAAEREALATDLEPAAQLQLALETLAECRERLVGAGVDLTAYNSAENAADVADLRRALGYDEWNLYGISYGTRLALTVLRDHPEGVRSVILDSVYPPSVDGTAEFPDNVARAFRVFFDGCAGDPECRAAYPDLEQRFYRLVSELDAAPVDIPVGDRLTGEAFTQSFDGDDLLSALFDALYSNEIYVALPSAIAALEGGDTLDFSQLESIDLTQDPFLSIGMHFATQCREEVPFTSVTAAAAAAENYPQLGSLTASAEEYLAVCELWDTGAAPPLEAEAVSSPVPALVMAGGYDPITPPAWAQAGAAGLPNSHYVEFPALGHGVTVSGDCPAGVALAFLADPSAVPDTSCVAPAPGFLVPGPPPTVTLVPFTAEALGREVAGVAPQEWEEVAPGSHARQRSALDPTVLSQLSLPAVPVAFLIAGLDDQGLDPEELGPVDAGGRSWQLYTYAQQGADSVLAAVSNGGALLLAELVARPDEIEGLVDSVLIPALEGREA